MKQNQKQKDFSVYRRLVSFRYAIQGIVYLVKTQHNVWIHLLATILVVIAGFYFSVSGIEWAILVLAMGMVFSAETFNTAFEVLVDKLWPGEDKQAGLIKDLAAGAVLFTALAAATAGILIFVPRIFG